MNKFLSISEKLVSLEGDGKKENKKQTSVIAAISCCYCHSTQDVGQIRECLFLLLPFLSGSWRTVENRDQDVVEDYLVFMHPGLNALIDLIVL